MNFTVGEFRYNVSLSDDRNQLFIIAENINDVVNWTAVYDGAELSAVSMYTVFAADRKGNCPKVYTVKYPEHAKDGGSLVIEMHLESLLPEFNKSIFIELQPEKVPEMELLCRKVDNIREREQSLCKEVAVLRQAIEKMAVSLSTFPIDIKLCGGSDNIHLNISAILEKLLHELAEMKQSNRIIYSNFISILAEQRTQSAKITTTLAEISASLRGIIDNRHN